MVAYEDMTPRDIQSYNQSYNTGLQLAYHYMAPLLIRGAEARKLPSVVMNMSSISAVLNRGMASMLPLYVISKAATNAITRTAHGMYSSKNVLSYGINPYLYRTDMAVHQCHGSGVTLEQRSSFMNPFGDAGDPLNMGSLSVALAANGGALESGVSYGMFPIPTEFHDNSNDDANGDTTMSILYRLASVHGADMEGLDYTATLEALTTISEAWYSNGTPVSSLILQTIVEAIKEQVRQRRRRSDGGS